MKRIIYKVFIMFICMISIFGLKIDVHAEEIASGTYWKLDVEEEDGLEEYILTISQNPSSEVDDDIVPWEEWSYQIDKVIVKNGVSSIGKSWFSGCVELRNIELPESVVRIEEDAFNTCFSLKSIELPENLVEIGDYAFFNGALTNIELPEGLTSIGKGAFCNCELTNIYIPKGVMYIGEAAFDGFANTIEKIVVNEKNYVFDSRNDCNAIIEKGTNTLIKGCINTVIPNDVKTIGDYAFSGCYELKNVELPDDLEKIGNWAFAGCYELKNIELPEKLKSIGEYAFDGCNLTNINVPKEVESIGKGAFDNYHLQKIEVDENNRIYDSRNDCNAIIEKKTNRLIIGCINTVVPNSVELIGEEAFWYCEFLAEIELPKSLKSIEDNAFSQCYGLTSIQFPDGLEKIGKNAFGSSGLTSIKLPENLIVLEDSIFSGCDDLTSVEFSKSIKSIGEYAFSGCTELTNIELPDDLVSIGFKAFSSSGLISIEIPDKLRTIEGRTFCSCESLKKVIIPKSVTSIDQDAFLGCINLKDVYYSGTEAEWNEILIYGGNEDLLNANIHFEKVEDGNEKQSFSAAKDGWSMINTAASFQYEHDKWKKYSIPAERYEEVFGASYVATAQASDKDVFKSMMSEWIGNCYGMSTTSILFYNNLLDWSKYNEGEYATVNEYHGGVNNSGQSIYTFSEKNSQVTKLIEQYQILQMGANNGYKNIDSTFDGIDGNYVEVEATQNGKWFFKNVQYEHIYGGDYIDSVYKKILSTDNPLMASLHSSRGSHAVVIRTDKEPLELDDGWIRIYI